MKHLDTTLCRNATLLRQEFDRLIRAQFDTVNQEKIRGALALAEEVHLGKTRDGNQQTAYIAHPLRVACRLMERLGINDPDLVCAAILHDVVEDGPESATGRTQSDLQEQIETEFGASTLHLVCTLTRRPGENRGGKPDAFESPYIDRIRKSGDETIVLKLLDKIDNLLDAQELDDTTRRERYLFEVFTAYAPLANAIERDNLSTVLSDDLLTATAAHEPSLVGRVVDRHLLCNPRVRDWVSWDGARLAIEPVEPSTLAARIAMRWCQVTSSAIRAVGEGGHERRIAHLMNLLGLPLELLPRDSDFRQDNHRRSWLRLVGELEEFAKLIATSTPPAWLEPVVDDAELLVLAVLSLVFRPESWAFPLWHDDAGAALAGRIEFGYLQARADETRRWRSILGILLTNRNAVHRYAMGSGSKQRIRELSSWAPATNRSAPALWAIRSLVEYLDLFGRRQYDADKLRIDFEKLWPNLMESEEFGAVGPHLCFEPAEIWQAVTRPAGLEVYDLRPAKELFDKVKTEPDRARPIIVTLLDALTQELANSSAGTPWIIFDIAELCKRRSEFVPELSNIPVQLSIKDLPKYGLIAQREDVAGRTLLFVRPAPRYAFSDRLPEVSVEQSREESSGRPNKDDPNTIEKLQNADFDATAVFDRMLLDHYDPEHTHAGRLWIPRVFRVLDSMEDLDPTKVQRISIILIRPDSSLELPVWLPLPRAEEAPLQTDRKRLLARYITMQIYSAAVICRLTEVRVHCAPFDGPHGFTDNELAALIAAEEVSLGIRPQLVSYCENFNFEPFHVKTGTSVESMQYTSCVSDMQAIDKTVLGIDIGGTDVKFCLWRNGRLSADGGKWVDLYKEPIGDERVVGRFSTPKPSDPNRPFTVDQFCAALIKELEAAIGLKDLWAKLDAIGLSWAGGVRENRIVAVSGVLGHMGIPDDCDDRVAYSKSTPVNGIHAVRFCERFRLALPADIKPHLTIALENDGSAEALGNYAARLLKGDGAQPGKLSTVVLKLGTSLAGARITSDGAVGDDLAEYSKAHLSLNGPLRVMREFLSSLAVRLLIRSFKLRKEDQAPLFGTYGKLNKVDPKEPMGDAKLLTRVESQDIGVLLPLWATVDSERRLLRDCIDALIREEAPPIDGYIKDLTDAFADEAYKATLSGELDRIVEALGKLMRKKIKDASDPDLSLFKTIAGDDVDSARDAGSDSSSNADLVRRLGVARLRWLITGKGRNGDEGMPTGTAWNRELAKKTIGAVLIFSHIGLHIAHAIAQLFNSYGKKTFDRVILAGGVLSDDTGKVVEEQTKAFLARLYDKIYSPTDEGPTKPLQGDAVSRATNVVDPDALGPLGAAMSALRQLRMESAMRLDEAVGAYVSLTHVGSEVSVNGARNHLTEEAEATDREVLTCLKRRMAEGHLLPEAGGLDCFLKIR